MQDNIAGTPGNSGSRETYRKTGMQPIKTAAHWAAVPASKSNLAVMRDELR